MNTEILTIDQLQPDPVHIQRAAEMLRNGRLVAFPTETVYGLGANALDAAAVRGIFEAKGRPNTNPVIVHVADSVQVVNVASDWPETAERLASRFWPGALTLVLPRRSSIPNEVTAGGPTIAVRCPDHPVAQALIRAAKVPIAAPSANRSTELSPTRAEHVWNSLNGRIDLILDAGPCPAGIESTVVDATSDPVRLLRPGPISVTMLEDVIGEVVVGAKPDGIARSPGHMAKHYSPQTPLRLVESDGFFDKFLELTKAGKRVGVVVFRGADFDWPQNLLHEIQINLTDDPRIAASRLYNTLHQLDQSYLDVILVEEPTRTPEWAAIRDRLRRAASA